MLPADRYTGCSRCFGSCKIATKGILLENEIINDISRNTLSDRIIPGIAARNGGFSSPPLRISWAVTEPPPALPPQMVICTLSVLIVLDITSQNCTHLAWITAESRDMSLRPIDRRSLIKQSSIGRSIFSNIIACQEAVCSQSVLNRHEYDAAVGRADKVRAASISSVTNSVSTTVNPQQYWQALVDSVGRGKHIEDQTIFARSDWSAG